MIKVIATATGFDGQAVRNPGDEFEMPDGSSGEWFKPLEGDTKKAPKGKGKAAEEDLA